MRPGKLALLLVTLLSLGAAQQSGPLPDTTSAWFCPMHPAVTAGRPVTLFLTVRHPETHALITGYELVHEKPFHLFIVSRDMEFFEHIHPTQQRDGRWTIEVTLPKP